VTISSVRQRPIDSRIFEVRMFLRKQVPVNENTHFQSVIDLAVRRQICVSIARRAVDDKISMI
jgi:hypothetical protein